MRRLWLALLTSSLFAVAPVEEVKAEAETKIEAEEEIDWKAKYEELLEKYNQLLEKYEKLINGETEEGEIGDSIPGVSLQYGTLLSATKGVEGVVIVKAKIEGMLNNELTIRQNYYNILDLVQNQGFDKYKEIQYWAVADLNNGTEGKVISFTVDEDTIKTIKLNWVTARGLDIYLKDLWILPSLKQ